VVEVEERGHRSEDRVGVEGEMGSFEKGRKGRGRK
jgi:hypothetical protein